MGTVVSQVAATLYKFTQSRVWYLFFPACSICVSTKKLKHSLIQSTMAEKALLKASLYPTLLFQMDLIKMVVETKDLS